MTKPKEDAESQFTAVPVDLTDDEYLAVFGFPREPPGPAAKPLGHVVSVDRSTGTVTVSSQDRPKKYRRKP